MSKYHKLLNRQLKKYLPPDEDNHQKYEPLFNAISDAYYAFDDDRLMVERSLDISSKELNEVITKLQLTQGTLITQEKMAAIGHLAAGVAHEINNPLGYIVSNFSTLGEYVMILEKYMTEITRIIDEDVDNDLHEMLTRIKKKMEFDYIIKDIPEVILDSNEGLSKIRRIVNGLRHFSQVDKPDDLGYFDLREGVENTLIVTSNEIKQVAAVVKEFEKVPLLRVDGSEINQVVLNLVLNAVDAIRLKKHRGVIHVKTFTDNNHICLSVKDNGVGIENRLLDTIFNPFFTTKDVGQGTGLGLSMVYDIIVNKNRGKINVTSELGKGSCFEIRLPDSSIK